MPQLRQPPCFTCLENPPARPSDFAGSPAAQPSEDSLRQRSDKTGLLLLWRPGPWKTRRYPVKSAAVLLRSPYATSNFTPKKAFKTNRSAAVIVATPVKGRQVLRGRLVAPELRSGLRRVRNHHDGPVPAEGRSARVLPRLLHGSSAGGRLTPPQRTKQRCAASRAFFARLFACPCRIARGHE